MKPIRAFLCDLWRDPKKRILLFAVSFAILASLASLGIWLLWPSKAAKKPEKEPKTEEAYLPITEPETAFPTEEEISATLENEPLSKEALAKGIDVSKWQGKIDWKKAKAAGIEFAMIRLGYKENGECFEDENAAWNLMEAEKNGVLTGVYFYSGATTPKEAEEEAKWVLSKIGKFAISYPVVFDYEIKAAITAEVRTDTALSFLNGIKGAGYEAMLYVALKEFEDPTIWQRERILAEHLVWGARYTQNFDFSPFYPETAVDLAMWQYSDQGSVDGISGNVDLNASYILRSYCAPKNPDSVEVDAPDDFRQSFQSCHMEVTAKNEVNLRKTPSMDGEIAGTLKHGEYLLCTGQSDMGWSRLEKNGEKLYAVTSYLVTSSGESQTPNEVFSPCHDTVTAKESVNLRLAPSTDAEIAGLLEHGTPLLRTGIGDKGWSRLDFGGTTVYAVTSYLEIVQ